MMQNRIERSRREAQIGLRLTPEQRAKIEALASATGRSISGVVAELIDRAVAKPVVTMGIDVQPQGEGAREPA